MPKKSKTSYFTTRGKNFGNLWAAYSLKADKVLLLGSDRQLAHWLLNLEFSPDVRSFAFQPGSKILVSTSPSSSQYNLDFHFEVLPVQGATELHFLRVNGYSANVAEKIDVALRKKYIYKEFNDDDWAASKWKVFPLLRVSTFLCGGKNTYIPFGLVEEANVHVNTHKYGSLKSYLSGVQNYDRNLCLLVFCRMYAEGKIQVNFDRVFFALDTQWWLNEN
ncbi:hypothetical protein [Pseudomonas caspiana]|uniref:hypothetical protein n=1 Tax=Pseudomonas caspiana TaxID=1451454 RepID=UPI0032ED873F